MRLTLATAALALTAGLAQAQTSPAQTSPTPAPGAPMSAGTDAASRLSRYQAIQAVKMSMAQAIDAAEAQGGGGGRAIDVEFERADRNEPAHYEIKVLGSDGKLVEHYVNAETGQIYKSENQPIERYFTRLKVEDVRGARTTLKQAIAAAEARAGAGARAIEAEVERSGSTVVYEVDVATADRTREFKVGADGQVTDG